MKTTSLAARLSLAFILVVVLGIATVSILIRRETAQGFQGYLEARGGMFVTRVEESLSQYYRANGGWSNAQSFLVELTRSSDDRFVLADASGRVVADTDGQWIGAGEEVARGSGVIRTAIQVDGKTVGALYSPSPGQDPGGPGRGRGMMGGQAGGRGMAGGAAAGPPTATLEAGYLALVDRAIWAAAAVSGLFAIAIGLLAARRITSPLADLRAAAREVASGKLAHRVKVSAQDEVGEVARAFNTMAESLEQNELTRQRMVADIAHDLRTPLTVIEGTVDGILDGVFEADRSNLESIKEEVSTLTKMVSDLRTLSLAEAGQLRLETEPVEMADLARRGVARIEPLAQRKGVACRVEAGPEPLMVRADPDRMGQVLGNLLDNALRYTPSGGTIVVSACRGGPRCPGDRAGSAGRVIVAVSDSGEGIAPEKLPYLFDRFYKVDESRTRSKGGSGLGLAIVKQLVEAHGGRVWADSEPGKGSRFVVELPALETVY